MNEQTEELQVYFARVRPIYRELFAMAHAICGNYDAAEYVLQKTIQDGWTANEKGHTRAGFRENMRELLCANAVREATRPGREPVELTWTAFELNPELDELDPENMDPEEEFLLGEVRGEDMPMRRLLMLHYGCGLANRETARVLEIPVRQLQDQLERFAARTRRGLPARLRRHYETCMERLMRQEMSQTKAVMPEPGSVYRRFEAEVSQVRRASHRWLSRSINAVIVVVLALLCAGLFWLLAVLIHPTEMEDPSEAARSAPPALARLEHETEAPSTQRRV